MAMTGGTARLVAEGTPSGWPGPIALYVYYKEKSQSIDGNYTVLSLGMYVTTPRGWYFGSWKDSYGSYIGTTTSGADCRSFDGYCPEKTQVLRWLVEDVDITVPHNNDGTKNATIYWKWGVSSSWGGINRPSGSFAVKLTAIPRASAVSSASGVTLGDNCSIKWTPNSASFRYKLKFSLGSWSYTTGIIHPNTTSSYTYTGYAIPMEVANQLPNAFTGEMSVTLYTYSDSGATTQIGSADTATFRVTVPTSAAPKVLMSLSPVHSLPAAFDGIYVQGLSKVKAVLSAEGEYNSRIMFYDMTVEGKTYGADADYTSGYLSNPGSIWVVGHAEDSRHYGGYTDEFVTVIPYSPPKIQNVTAGRCDQDGNLSDAGTYLKITAKRSYYPVVSDGVQKNFCQIRYRHKTVKGATWSDWTEILAADSLDSDEVTTPALLDGEVLVSNSYVVEVQVVDDIGYSASVTIVIPTDKVYWHRDGSNDALGLGKYNERENAVDSAWDFYMNGHKITGLPIPVDDADAVPKSYVAPADIQLKKSLSAAGWYKLGTITANMCSVMTLTIGGVFQNNQASTAIVDIATQYSNARIYTIMPATAQNQISRIGLVVESALQFGVYAYYNSTRENPVHINVHPSMGTFVAADWETSDVSDGDMAVATALNNGLLTEYIVEQGTSGIWSYRKWSSGRAECWGVYSQSNVVIATAWGSLFESPGYVVDLPSGLFVETPQFSITLIGTGGVMLETYSKGSSTQSPHMCAVRPNTQTVETLNTSITAHGRWK